MAWLVIGDNTAKDNLGGIIEAPIAAASINEAEPNDYNSVHPVVGIPSTNTNLAR
jgi:hypothetical protein